MKKVILAGFFGNALEMYDYTLYGYFASILAIHFFGSQDPITALLATYGIYASGFLFRPIGAVIIGSIGDRYGRKRALEISILMMAIPTLCIGLLPTYATIGIAAPILLTVIRLIQGMSVGGELTGSFTFLVEHADPSQKGYMGSWSVIGGSGGKVLGTLTAGALSLVMTAEALEGWGWRIPFILGLIFAAAGFYIRQKVDETPIFQKLQTSKKIAKAPWKQAFTEAPTLLLKGVGIQAISSAFVHTLFIYLPIYLKTQLNYSYSEAWFTTLIALITSMFFMPLSGVISDRIGRWPVLFYGTGAITLMALPAFLLMNQGSANITLATLMVMAATFGLLHGSYPAQLSELFPPHIRNSASAISYNFGVLLFGGLAPIAATSLIYLFDSPIAPVAWMIFCGTITLTTLVFTDETHHAEMPLAA